jgi:hypothetical protein
MIIPTGHVIASKAKQSPRSQSRKLPQPTRRRSAEQFSWRKKKAGDKPGLIGIMVNSCAAFVIPSAMLRAGSERNTVE